jgi:hypothetical protein
VADGSVEPASEADPDPDPAQVPEMATPVGVCSLAADAEVSAALGNEVVGIDIDPTLCEYAPVAGTIGQDSVALDVFRNQASGSTCDLEFGGVGATSGETVEGLGDAAYWRGDVGPRQLFIYGAGSFVALTLYTPASVPVDESLAAAREVASLVMSRL